LHNLVFSDFGLRQFHLQTGRILEFPSTFTYRAPEFDLEEVIGQPSDMWGLGCVYLELVSWFMVGHEETYEVFSVERLSDDLHTLGSIPGDKFYNLIPRKTNNKYATEVKGSVKGVSNPRGYAKLKLQRQTY